MILKNTNILIVDDDTDVLTAVRLLLKSEAKEVVTEKNPENLRWQLSQKQFDVLLLDMNFNSSINTGNEGLFWLKKVKTMALYFQGQKVAGRAEWQKVLQLDNGAIARQAQEALDSYR